MPSFKSAAIAFGIVFLVLLVIALMRRSRFGDPVERVAGMMIPGVPNGDPPGAAT